MLKLLESIGKVSAVAGVLICAISGLVRLSGTYYIASIQTTTLFTVGMAGMVLAILIKLHLNDMK